MFKGTLEQFGDVKVIGMDTISDLVEEDAGSVIVCASHGASVQVLTPAGIQCWRSFSTTPA